MSLLTAYDVYADVAQKSEQGRQFYAKYLQKLRSFAERLDEEEESVDALIKDTEQERNQAAAKREAPRSPVSTGDPTGTPTRLVHNYFIVHCSLHRMPQFFLLVWIRRLALEFLLENALHYSHLDTLIKKSFSYFDKNSFTYKINYLVKYLTSLFVAGQMRTTRRHHPVSLLLHRLPVNHDKLDWLITCSTTGINRLG